MLHFLSRTASLLDLLCSSPSMIKYHSPCCTCTAFLAYSASSSQDPSTLAVSNAKRDGCCWKLLNTGDALSDIIELYLSPYSLEIAFVNRDLIRCPEGSRWVLAFLPPISNPLHPHRSFRCRGRLTPTSMGWEMKRHGQCTR